MDSGRTAAPGSDEVRVLVVDDVEDVCMAMARHLELDGYVTRCAVDSTTALSVIDSFSPHCVLLDVFMPGLDGFALATRIRELYGDDIVLIAVTGRSADEVPVAGTFAMVDHYLQKPVDHEVLRKILPNLGT